MDIVKGLLMGCGALAILGLAGCVGLMGLGSYAIDQAIEEQNQLAQEQGPPTGEAGADPFSDYEGRSSDWGEGSQ